MWLSEYGSDTCIVSSVAWYFGSNPVFIPSSDDHCNISGWYSNQKRCNSNSCNIYFSYISIINRVNENNFRN